VGATAVGNIGGGGIVDGGSGNAIRVQT